MFPIIKNINIDKNNFSISFRRVLKESDNIEAQIISDTFYNILGNKECLEVSGIVQSKTELPESGKGYWLILSKTGETLWKFTDKWIEASISLISEEIYNTTSQKYYIRLQDGSRTELFDPRNRRWWNELFNNLSVDNTLDCEKAINKWLFSK